VSVLLAGCAKPVDKAAKQRIFSAEDPPAVISAASEKLPPERIADDPAVAQRVLEMGAAEATERLGAHRFLADVSFEWAGKGRVVREAEKRTLVSGAGGVGGDFDAVEDINSQGLPGSGQGLEVLRVHGDVYARDKFGRFRQRKRDRGMAERAREDVHGALRDFASLFQDRLKLEPQGTATFEGRTVWKYVASLVNRAPVADAKLPALLQARTGRDVATERRLRFFDKRSPKALSGELWVDAEKSVVLKAHLDGRMTAPGENKEGDVALHMLLDAKVSDIGKEPGLRTPSDALPDVDKPEGIADALDRFGIPRAGKHADAGVDEAPEDEAQ